MAAIVSCPYSDYTFTSTLDTSGNTTDYLTVQNWRYHTLQLSTTGTTGTVTSFVVRVEGSNDGTTWYGIDPSSNNWSADYSGNLTFTVNIPKAIRFRGKFNYIRVFKVSSAGTATTIATTIKYSGG